MEKISDLDMDRALRDRRYDIERSLWHLSGIDRVDITRYDASYGSFSLRLDVRLYDSASRRWAESDIKRKLRDILEDMVRDLGRNYDVSNWSYPRIYVDINFEGGQ